MSRLDEVLTEQFYRWELRGRGWWVFPEPVRPEPPFCPFLGHFLPAQPVIDDGRRPSFLGSLFARHKPEPAPEPVEEPEPEPEVLFRPPLIELQTLLPANLNLRNEEFAQFLSSLSLCHEPVTFELLGTPDRVSAQFAAHPQDAGILNRQLRAYFPDVVFVPREGGLQSAWQTSEDAETAIIEFGLAHEFMLPLSTTRIDAFVGIVAALAELQPRELAVYQVIFEPTINPWPESTLRAVTDNDGKPFFVNAPEIVGATERKIAHPLYGVVVRLATRSGTSGRAWEIARNIASALGVFARPGSNELIPLKNDDYPDTDHEEDVLRRQCRRAGMLLNAEELIGFVHLPSAAVRAPQLERQTLTSRPAPPVALGTQGLLLGDNTHAGKAVPVRLTPEQRVRHVHVIGTSGTGKSTFLFNLMRQDIENGEGLAVLDPHGDLVDRLLGVIPEHRIDDVVLLDPADEAYSVGFNILSARGDLEKNVLASDLVSVFERLSTSWGDQMGSVLQNAIMAILESTEGGTLADLRRFLIESEFRSRFLTTVNDPDIVYYWEKGFPQLTGNRSVGPILTRLETFLSPKPIRYMVSQKDNRLDFASIMDTGKIFLARLPQGQIGKENAFLLGSLLVAKFQQTAMARQATAASARKDFWLYLDEFQNFITPSMAEILTGARKYRLGLVLAHQELRQLQRDAEVASAVLANPGTRIAFRLGDDDARKLAEGFAHFEARDLQNLEKGQAICRIERSDWDFNLAVPLPVELDPAESAVTHERVLTASRQRYGKPKADVEATLAKGYAESRKKSVAVTNPQTGSPDAVVRNTANNVTPTSSEPQSKPTTPAKEPESSGVTPPAPARAGAAEPKTLGRGGRQHKYLQHLVKELAIGMNFEVEVEKQILDGDGSVDVALKKGEQRSAFEISVATGTEHEIGNLRKCLKAGFGQIVMVCVEPVALARLRDTATKELDEADHNRVRYCLPDELPAVLIELSASGSAKDTVSHGRKTRVTYRAITAEEAKRRREAIAQVATRSLKKPK